MHCNRYLVTARCPPAVQLECCGTHMRPQACQRVPHGWPEGLPVPKARVMSVNYCIPAAPGDVTVYDPCRVPPMCIHSTQLCIHSPPCSY